MAQLTKVKAFELMIEKLEDVESILLLCRIATFVSKTDGIIPWKYYFPRLEKNMKTVEYMKKFIWC